MSKSPLVTFGVEIEFVVKGISGIVDRSLVPPVIPHNLPIPQEGKDKLREGEPWRQFTNHIVKSLQENGIPNGKLSQSECIWHQMLSDIFTNSSTLPSYCTSRAGKVFQGLVCETRHLSGRSHKFASMLRS